MLSSSGGTDNSVKNAASAARSRLRYSMHELTVSLSSSQAVLRLDTFRYRALAVWRRPDGSTVVSLAGCTCQRYTSCLVALTHRRIRPAPRGSGGPPAGAG